MCHTYGYFMPEMFGGLNQSYLPLAISFAGAGVEMCLQSGADLTNEPRTN